MQKSPAPLQYFIGQLLRENNFSHVRVCQIDTSFVRYLFKDIEIK